MIEWRALYFSSDMRPHSSNAIENATPSSGTSPLASYKEVPTGQKMCGHNLKPRGWGYSLCVAPKGMVFAPFWSENGYAFCPFWSGIRYDFGGNYGNVWTYLSFQFQMSTGKERLIYEFEVDFKKYFIWRSNLVSNDDIISEKPVLKTSKDFRGLGAVVRTPVSANPGLNFNPDFFFFLSSAHYRIIFSILFRVSNHQIVGKEN